MCFSNKVHDASADYVIYNINKIFEFSKTVLMTHSYFILLFRPWIMSKLFFQCCIVNELTDFCISLNILCIRLHNLVLWSSLLLFLTVLIYVLFRDQFFLLLGMFTGFFNFCENLIELALILGLIHQMT